MLNAPLPLRAVWCSAHHWNSAIQVSAHQLARELAGQGWEVLFLSTPVTPYHAAAVHRSADHRARFRAWHRRGRRIGDVIAHTPMTLAPLSMVIGLRYDSILRNWQRFTVPPLARDLRRLGFERPDLLVVDTPLYGFLINGLGAKRFVYRVTDYNPGFASGSEQLHAMEREAASASDLTVYTSSHLEDYARSLGATRAAMIGHGVDFERFSTAAPSPPEYRRIPSPRAVYVGSLREWFDYDLVNRMAETLPLVSFVVIGPEHWARRRFADLPNLHVLGERAHSSIPGYLQHADVGLIPFDRQMRPDLVDAINPLKLYECAAAGLPVVSTDFATVAHLESPALLATSAEQFVDHLRTALRDQDALQQKSRAWSARHTWAQRCDELLAAVDVH